MKHLFIVNPKAGGKQHSYEKTIRTIKSAMETNGGDYEIYITKRQLDAAEKVRRDAERGIEMRVYACGGDGTFHECINGAVGFDNVAVTNFPCGTGNDFIRLFGDEKILFSDINSLINGFVHPIDVIRCNDRYSVNICSVGFDARVGTDVHKYSKLPLISGMASYVVSLVVNFFKGINRKFTIKIGNNTYTDEYALICVCNGRFYGGGFNPILDAMPHDGIMDTLIVKKCSRFDFMAFIKKYSTGRYFEIERLVSRVSDGKIYIESDDEMAINLDGELLKSHAVEFELVHNGVNLLCPKGMSFFVSSMKNQENLSK